MSVTPLLSTSSASFTFAPTILRQIESGPGSISKLGGLLEKFDIKTTLIVTGQSLATKTNVIERIQQEIEKSGCKVAGVHSKIGQHAPIATVRQGLDLLKQHAAATTSPDECGLVAVGGGSPIDSAKAMIKFFQEDTGNLLKMISIPTTLSAAEMTILAGYTDETGKKTGFKGRDFTSTAVIYDAELALSTPNRLWVSTGIRALDHAVEQQIRPGASLPVRALAREAAASLFEALEACAKDEKDVAARQRAFAASSLSLWSDDLMGPIGLSHALGYNLGSPYSMPHGICSCITLGMTVKSLSTVLQGDDLKSMASLLAFIDSKLSSSLSSDTERVSALGEAIDQLVKRCGVSATLSEYKVPEEDLNGIVERSLKGVGRDSSAEGELYKSLLKGLKARM